MAFEIRARDSRPRMSESTPPGAQALIRACWGRDPAARPAAFEEVLGRLDALLAADSEAAAVPDAVAAVPDAAAAVPAQEPQA